MTQKGDTTHSEGRWLLRTWTTIILAAAVPLLYYVHFVTIRSSFAPVIPGRVYRSNQPSASNLQSWIDDYGIRTVLTLRLPNAQMTERIGGVLRTADVEQFIIGLSAYLIPTPKQIVDLAAILDTAERPILLHCFQGIDRSGLVSAIAAMAVGDLSYQDAIVHAYVPPGPWKRRRKHNFIHVSDMLDRYEQYCHDQNLGTAGWKQFRTWISINCEDPND